MAQPIQRQAKFPAVIFHLPDLPRRHIVKDGQAAVVRGNAVVHRRQRLIGPAHLEAALA
jgi:hypothetical protein